MVKRKRKTAASAAKPDDPEDEAQGDGDGGSGSSGQNLYDILGVQRTASQEEIKKAYHKLALRLHPDKNPGDKDANEKFQTLQSVISVLGDSEKRAIYDETGSLEETELIGKRGKSLYDFFRTLYKPVTEEDLETFAAAYRGSEQEKADLKKLYTKCNGNMNRVFHMLMCSDPKIDSHRFMETVDAAIATGELKGTNLYRKWAKEIAKQPAPAAPLAPPRKKNGKEASADLVAAIESRGKRNMDSLFSAMEAKYSGNKKNKKGAKCEEPLEEEFQAARERLEAKKKRRK